MISSTPRHVCSFLIPASGTVSNPIHHQNESPGVEKSFIRRCNSSRASLNSSSNMSRNSSLSQIQQDSQSSVAQPLGLKRNNSFNSTTTSSSTISTSAPTSSTNNNTSPTKSFRQLGSLAIPINSQRSSPLHVAFHRYLLAPTSDGRLLIYQVCDFDHAESIILEEELSYSSSSSMTLNATKPISDIRKLSSQVYQEKHNQMPVGIIGPLHVGEYMNIPVGSSESTTSSMKDNSPPVSIVGLTSIHANDASLSSLLGYVALITLQGDVFVFEFHKSDQESSLQIQFFCGFGCGRISAQCIALRYHQSKLLLACGFEDGIIQEFEVKKNLKSQCWEGYLNHRPITCLAYITDLVQGQENAIEDATSLSQLIVGMSQCEPQPTGRSKPEDIIATCLEVVSVDVAKSMWDQKMNDSASMLPSPISLIESTVWPTNEFNHVLQNARNHHSHSLERVESKKVSHELHSIHSVQVSRSSFTIAMSNGAVATLKFWINHQEKFCWGMATMENQCILSSPTCGLGMLNNHIATCSRDASVIILPNQTENKLQSLKSPVLLSIPIESIGFDEDDLVRYVQGFCAGEIQTKIWGSSRESEPNVKQVQALFVAWPGGCIECYSFEYLSRDVLKQENLAVMTTLSEDGILQELFSLFRSYLNDPSYDGDSLLGRAAKEYQQWEGDDNELILSLMNQNMGSSSIVQFLFAQITES